MTKILIVGATSVIAHETAKIFAREGAELFLVGRNADKLEAVKNDLKVRGAEKVESFLLDLNEVSRHTEMLECALAALGRLDTVLVAHGTLGNQKECEQDVAEALTEFNTNCTNIIALLTPIANYFEKQQNGCIAVISSVAGDRGRQSNYVYGSAKAGLTAFLQGMRNRLSAAGVTVLTIKPGPVVTPMTTTHKKTALFASPEKVGKDIHTAITKRKDVLYTPFFWRFIMLIVIHIPERIFKKLNLT